MDCFTKQTFHHFTKLLALGVALVVAATSQAQSAALPAAPSCSSLFQADLQSQLREEILASNVRDQNSGREAARFSNFIEGRAVAIRTPPDAYHAVSLGSGPDIFLPLYLYPNAKVFHLIDTLEGWGTEGPDHVVTEMETRLRAVASDVQIERLDRTTETINMAKSQIAHRIWRVTWDSPSSGRQEKIFYFHRMSFDDLGAIKKLGLRSLGGIVITGIDPKIRTRLFFLNLLEPEGSMFTEMGSDEKSIFKRLGKLYSIVRLQPQGDRPGYWGRFGPSTYEVRPKK